MDTLVKTLCVVSSVWIAGFSDSQCTGYGTGPPDTGHPSDPNPSHGSIGVPFEPVLSWHMNSEMDDDDFTYDVYFGTGENLKNPPLVAENLDSNEYYTDTLDYGTMYSWRVVATEKGAYSPGDHRVSEGPLTMTYRNWNSELVSPVFDIYPDSSGSIDLSFYYKREFPDRIPKLEFFINVSGGRDIELFSGWVDNDDWALAEYTVYRSDLLKRFRIHFRTYHYEPTSEDASVLVDDVLVKFNPLE